MGWDGIVLSSWIIRFDSIRCREIRSYEIHGYLTYHDSCIVLKQFCLKKTPPRKRKEREKCRERVCVRERDRQEHDIPSLTCMHVIMYIL